MCLEKNKYWLRFRFGIFGTEIGWFREEVVGLLRIEVLEYDQDLNWFSVFTLNILRFHFQIYFEW